MSEHLPVGAEAQSRAPETTRGDAPLPDDDTSPTIRRSDDEQRHFVIDYTVGPPGVGPATTVVPEVHPEISADKSAEAGSLSVSDVPYRDAGEVLEAWRPDTFSTREDDGARAPHHQPDSQEEDRHG